MKSRVTRKIVPAVLIVAVIGGGLGWWWTRGEAASVDQAAAMETAKVERGELRQAVDCTGRVVSNLDVEIKCRASGEIVKLPYDVSDKVKKGDLLVELDPTDQERLVQQSAASLSASEARYTQAEVALATAEESLKAAKIKAQASLESAQARAADTAAKAKREKELLEKKYSSPELMETARTTAVQAAQDLKTAQAQMDELKAEEIDLETKRQQIKLAKAQLDSDKIALSLAQRQLGYTKVYAPIDGVVASRDVQIGQIISSGISNVGGGTTVMTISDLSRVFILASVDESNIGAVKIGQSADITADAYPRKHFQGRVDRIATQGTNVQNVVTFEVRIEVMSPEKELLKPEMTANVSIVVADKPDALLVPATAVYRDRGDTFVALVRPDGTVEEKHPVEIGISDGLQTEILSGLNEGDTVQVLQADADSQWRATDDARQAARNTVRQQRMMMRTMGGGRH